MNETNRKEVYYKLINLTKKLEGYTSGRRKNKEMKEIYELKKKIKEVRNAENIVGKKFVESTIKLYENKINKLESIVDVQLKGFKEEHKRLKDKYISFCPETQSKLILKHF